MAIFDREVRCGFDSIFDLDEDGVLDPIEQGMEYEFLERESEEDDYDDDDDDDDDFWDDDDEEQAEMEEELTMAGLDILELSMMGENQRRGAIEDAGLDPDDFEDFEF